MVASMQLVDESIFIEDQLEEGEYLLLLQKKTPIITIIEIYKVALLGNKT